MPRQHGPNDRPSVRIERWPVESDQPLLGPTSIARRDRAGADAVPVPGLDSLPNVTTGEIAAYRALLQCGSFSEAAKRLYISQPGLSARIARLERALGEVLVERSARNLTLTQAGVRFAATAHSVLRLLAASTRVNA